MALWFSFNVLNTDLDSISFSVIVGGDIIDYVVDIRYNNFNMEAGANIYSFLGRSRSAFSTNGGICVVALIDGLSRFLEGSYCICCLYLYIS